MNKVAAEKIAQEYYNIGVHLALQNSGLVKEAGLLPKDILKKLVEYPSAAAGGVLGGIGLVDGLNAVNPEILKYLWHSDLVNIGGTTFMKSDPLLMATIGGGALVGGNLGSKGVDLARKKVPKAIDALKKLRT